MLPAAQHVRCRRTLARHFTLFPERAPMRHGNATWIPFRAHRIIESTTSNRSISRSLTPVLLPPQDFLLATRVVHVHACMYVLHACTTR